MYLMQYCGILFAQKGKIKHKKEDVRGRFKLIFEMEAPLYSW